MKTLLTAVLGLALTTPALSWQDEAPAPTPQSIAMDLFGLANQAVEAEDYEAARRLLEAALDLKPAHPAVLRGLLITSVRAGRA